MQSFPLPHSHHFSRALCVMVHVAAGRARAGRREHVRRAVKRQEVDQEGKEERESGRMREGKVKEGVQKVRDRWKKVERERKGRGGESIEERNWRKERRKDGIG